MLFSLLRPPRSQRCMPTALRALGALLFVALCVGQARAQIGGIDSDPSDPGTGGKNTLRGNIYYANGRRADKRVKVKLRSLYGEQFTMSDDSGSFSFRRLTGGTYNVVVDAGSEFDLAYETVDFIEGARRRDDIGQTQTVQITLYPKQATAKPVGTVDAASGGVPQEARTLYKDALDSAKTGNSKKAIEQLNAAIQIYPSFMSALNELGVQHMRLKQYDRSEEAFQQALKLAPQAFTPHLNYGILLIIKKDFVKAATHLQRAAQINGCSACSREADRLGPPSSTRLVERLAPLVARAEAWLAAEMAAGASAATIPTPSSWRPTRCSPDWPPRWRPSERWAWPPTCGPSSTASAPSSGCCKRRWRRRDQPAASNASSRW